MGRYVFQGPEGSITVKECTRCSALITLDAEQAHALWHHILSDLAKRLNGVDLDPEVWRTATPHPLNPPSGDLAKRVEEMSTNLSAFAFKLSVISVEVNRLTSTAVDAGKAEDSPV